MNEPFELYSRQIDSDPFPGYKLLRDLHPCYWSESAKLWILSRYDDVFNAATDWQTYSSLKGNLIDEIPGRSGGTLGTTDPPRHDRLRALAQSAFTRGNLEHLVAPSVEIADTALEKIRDRPSFDFVSEFSSLVTVGTIFRMMGLPERNPAEIRNEVVLSISTDKEKRGRNPDLDAAFRRLTQFLSEEVLLRRKSPADDLITHLAEAEIDGDRLSEREVVLTTTMFVVAGVESLSSFLSVFALNLAENAAARRELVKYPNKVPQAIEESLRYNTSAQRFKRTLTRDVVLYGETMKSGDSVVLAYGSANRDERKFTNPDVYDIERNPRGHLGFGTGKHFCIGNTFARIVTDIAIRRLLEVLPDFAVAAPNFEWVSSSNFRSPVRLSLAIGETK